MSVTRKLLVPMITFFALVSLTQVGHFTLNLLLNAQTEQTTQLNFLSQALDTQFNSMADLTIGLASGISNDPTVQVALAENDRQKLLASTQESYQHLKNLFNISLFQFHVPPATSFLRVNQPEKYGDNLAASRLTVVAANLQKRNVSGIELAQDGLQMRGVVPVVYQNNYVGSVEFNLGIDKAMLSRLKAKYQVDWNLMLSQQAIRMAQYDVTTVASSVSGETPVPELFLQATTMGEPLFAPVPAYEKALNGEDATSLVEVNSGQAPSSSLINTEKLDFRVIRSLFADQTYAIRTIPVRDFSGSVVGVIDVVTDRTAVTTAARRRVLAALLVGLGGLILGGIGLVTIARSILRPVRNLTDAAVAIAQGDLQRQAPVRLGKRMQQDEITQLALSFNSMTRQLRSLVGGLEQRVVERTQDLEHRSTQLQLAADVAREITTISGTTSDAAVNAAALLNHAVNLIRDRFDLYQVSIFLTDERGENVILRASTGEAGRQLLEQGFSLRIGAGIVGTAVGSGRPRVVSDVGADAVYYKDALLPATRSEMALPLRMGEQVVGALDVQSTRVAAFEENDIVVLQVIADQLTVALQNARLIQRLNQTVSELEQTYGRFTQEAWQKFLRKGKMAQGYRYRQGMVERIQDFAASGNGGMAGDAAAPVKPGTAGRLSAPILLRDQVIGMIDIHFQTKTVAPEMANLVEEAAGRLGLVLESTRLLQEAQSQAQREQLIGQIAARVRSTLNLDDVLQTTIFEIGNAMNAEEVEVRLGDGGQNE